MQETTVWWSVMWDFPSPTSIHGTHHNFTILSTLEIPGTPNKVRMSSKMVTQLGQLFFLIEGRQSENYERLYIDDSYWFFVFLGQGTKMSLHYKMLCSCFRKIVVFFLAGSLRTHIHEWLNTNCWKPWGVKWPGVKLSEIPGGTWLKDVNAHQTWTCHRRLKITHFIAPFGKCERRRLIQVGLPCARWTSQVPELSLGRKMLL